MYIRFTTEHLAMPCQNKDNNPLEMYLPRSRSVGTTYPPSSTSIKFKTKRINIFASTERSGKSKKWKLFSPKRQNPLIRNSDSSVALLFLSFSFSLSLFLSFSLSLSISLSFYLSLFLSLSHSLFLSHFLFLFLATQVADLHSLTSII